MEKLEEAKKLQVVLVEKQLKLVRKENIELRKMLNQSNQLLFNKSQPEVESLKSQMDFLELDQNAMPIGKLQEAFEEQISIAKKQWESLQDRKMHIEMALTDIIAMGDLVLDKLEEETESVKSYVKFLVSGHQIVAEEILAQTALEAKKSKLLKIAALNSKIEELQNDKEVTMKEILGEELKEKNEQEAMLLTSKMLKREPEPSISRVDIPEGDDKAKDSGVVLQQDSSVSIIEIDDDSTEVSPYSEVGEVEVSSSQSNIMAKGNRKQPIQLRTRCNQTHLWNFFSSLTGEKRRVIENSIFKPFLLLPSRSVCLSFLHAFIETYNVNSDSFTIDSHALRFCGKEVEACLGLKYEGKRVDYTTRVKGTPKIIKEYFGKEGQISKDELLEKLKQMQVNKNNANDFFRLSVYFMFSVYFFSTSDSYVSYWPVRYLEALEGFDSFGWGRAIYEYLMESVRKTAYNCSVKSSSISCVKGCIPLLETLVYERIGGCYLKFEVDPRFSHPHIIKYAKGDSRIPGTMRKVLAKVKFDKIKSCEDCSKETTTSLERTDTCGSSCR